MAYKKYLKKKTITLVEQKFVLKRSYPNSECFTNCRQLFWSGKLKPTPLSREYSVTIKYTLNTRPHIFVSGNELYNLESEHFPHKYFKDPETKIVEICLYRHNQFSSSMLLSDTIIPWAIEWLYFYELWLATGEWLGGGEHPVVKNK